MNDWKVLIDPMDVKSSNKENAVHNICFIVCCRVWPTSFGDHLRAQHCVICGQRPQLLLTDGNQVRLAQGLKEQD